MAKGRPRQNDAARTPAGRKSRSKAALAREYMGNMAVVQAQPHRAWLPKGARLDQLAESELGRLYLSKAILEHELGAGQNYLRLVTAYRMAISAPGNGTSVLGQMVGDAFANCEVAREPEGQRQLRLERQYSSAKGVLLGQRGGAMVLSVLGRVIVHDQAVGADIAPLRVGLAALANFWRMTPREERRGPAKITSWHAPTE